MSKALERLYDLHFAIWNRDYERIEELLSDESVPVNLFFPRFIKLPKTLVLESRDKRMIELFLKCARIDWLARDELNIDDLDKYGIEYDKQLKAEQVAKSKKVFQCLDPSFENDFIEESDAIYDKMFEALEKSKTAEELELVAFECVSSTYAFFKALNYCPDVNKKFKNGQTLLHYVCSANHDVGDLIDELVFLGADVNARDNNGATPLMYCMRGNVTENACKIGDYGAVCGSSDFKGDTELDYCTFDEDGMCCYFRAEMPLTKKMFDQFLKKPVRAATIEHMFEKYFCTEPDFVRDLVNNLARIIDFAKCELSSELKPADGLHFLRRYFEHNGHSDAIDLEQIDNHHFLRRIFRDNVDEFLHVAVKKGNDKLVETLLESYNANPNSVFDHLPPVFKASRGSIICQLLTAGADPSFTDADGCKFFQREGFAVDAEAGHWLHFLYNECDVVVDLLEVSPKTGKTIFEIFYAESSYYDANFRLMGPIKMTPLMLPEILSKSSDFGAPIDDEGNTVLHYLFTHPLKLVEVIHPPELTEVKNNNGLTPLDLLIRSEKFLDQIMGPVDIISQVELELIETEYNKFFGAGSFDSRVLDVAGAKLFFNLLDHDYVPYFQYFLDDKKLSADRIGVEIGRDTLKLATFDPESYNCGIHVMDLYLSMGSGENQHDLFKYQLTNRSDVDKVLFEYLHLCKERRSPCPISSIVNVKLEQFLRENPETVRKLCRYFFVLCQTVDDVNFLVDLGFDPKKSTDLIVGLSRYNSVGFNYWNVPMWEVLRDRLEMKMEDFDNIIMDDRNSLHLAIKKNNLAYNAFLRVFGDKNLLWSACFSDIDLNAVVGDKEACCLCRDAFMADDSVLKLRCNHLFHFDCVDGYLVKHQICPYCRKPQIL